MTTSTRSVMLAAAILCAAGAVSWDALAAAGGDPTVAGGGTGAAAAKRATVDAGTTPIRKVSAVSSNDTFTCTTTPAAMLTKRLIVAGSSPSNVAVLFQGEFFPGCRALLSLTRDGAVVPGPGDAASPMAAHDTNGELSTNGFNFIDKGVKPGLHSYSVRCACDSGTTTVDERSLTAFHQ